MPAACATIPAGRPDVPCLDVRVLWRLEQFTRVTNGGFELDTAGWAVTAGINAAGTSITRITTDSHSGAACASLVTSATSGGGANLDLGSDRFWSEASYGSVYVAVVWLRRDSGSRRAKIVLGSLGTAADRAILTIDDLSDDWRPYVLRWLPTASRTDAELAITNGSAEALTVRIDDVAVYQLDAFSQVENGTFETDTTGWTVAADVHTAAATSITRTAGGLGGSWHARVVTTAALNSGVTFPLGSRRFVAGRTYVLRAALRSVSGTATVEMVLGSGAAATSIETLDTTDLRPFTLEWNPGIDFWDVQVAFRSPTASARTFDVDEVEVYESSDSVTTHALRWDRSTDAVGHLSARVANATGLYDPRNASSALYGSVAPGRRILVRASRAGTSRGLFFGTLTTIEADPFTSHADLLAEDVMADLARAQHAGRFESDQTYANLRARAIGSVVTRDPRNESTSLGSSRRSLATGGPEGNTLWSGTDDLVPVASYLADLNEATQSVHLVRPSPHANIGWVYTVVDRATLTDGTSDLTVDEDFEDLTGVRLSRESLENQQTVPWQAFAKGPLPPDHWGIGDDVVVAARDRVAAAPGTVEEDDPYLHYTRPEYGDSSDVPEPTYRVWRRWRRRPKGRRLVTRRRRIFPDAYVPFTMAAGEIRRIAVDLALPVEGLQFSLTASGSPTVRYIERSPQRIVGEVIASAATIVQEVTVIGMPFTPYDEAEVQRSTGDETTEGQYPGPSFGTPYIPSLGDAEGIAEHRNWRYGDARLRPTLVDHNRFPRTLTTDVTDHVTLSADRWRIDAVQHVITGCRWEVTQGGLDWRAWHEMEELPTHSAWFILDSSTLDGATVLAY